MDLRIDQRYSPVTLARVSWIGARQWGRDSSDAHATSRYTQEKGTIGGRATPYRNRPHENERKDDPHPVSFAFDPGQGVLDWYNTVGTHSRVAHATSRNTQIREPSEAELLPSGIDPTKMVSTIWTLPCCRKPHRDLRPSLLRKPQAPTPSEAFSQECWCAARRPDIITMKSAHLHPTAFPSDAIGAKVERAAPKRNTRA